MKTIKVAEATNTQLDWLVAQIENHQSRCPWMIKEGWDAWQAYEEAWGNPIPKYTAKWNWMGPISEREHIGSEWFVSEWKAAQNYAGQPYKGAPHLAPIGVRHAAYGVTRLIAEARCYVIFKLGETVEVPEELP